MNTNLILDALGSIDDKYIMEAKARNHNYHISDAAGAINDEAIRDARSYEVAPQGKGRIYSNRFHRRKRSVSVLVAVIFVLAFAATALAASGVLGNILGWFGDLWKTATGQTMSEAQVYTITELTTEVGEAVQDNEITVTAQSITLGDSSMTLLFGVEIEGVTLSSDASYEFKDFWCDFVSISNPLYGDRGVSQSFYSVDENENKAFIVIKYDGGLPTEDILQNNCVMTVDLSGLVVSTIAEPVATTLHEGNWAFEISLDADCLPQEKISIEPLEVKGRHYVDGKSEIVDISIYDVVITPTGISFVDDGGFAGTYTIYACLDDGTNVETATGSGHRIDSGEYVRSYVWNVPVSLDELAQITINNTEIQISNHTS